MQTPASGAGPGAGGPRVRGAAPGASVDVQVGVQALAGIKLDLPASR